MTVLLQLVVSGQCVRKIRVCEADQGVSEKSEWARQIRAHLVYWLLQMADPRRHVRWHQHKLDSLWRGCTQVHGLQLCNAGNQVDFGHSCSRLWLVCGHKWRLVNEQCTANLEQWHANEGLEARHASQVSNHCHKGVTEAVLQHLCHQESLQFQKNFKY